MWRTNRKSLRTEIQKLLVNTLTLELKLFLVDGEKFNHQINLSVISIFPFAEFTEHHVVCLKYSHT